MNDHNVELFKYATKTDLAFTSQVVDDLGGINAQIADLQAKAKVLKVELERRIEAGTAAEGDLYRASHSVANRESVDWKAIAAKLNPSRQLITAHTSTKEVHTIRVAGRVANAAAKDGPQPRGQDHDYDAPLRFRPRHP
jgi:hypothetical protein